MQLTSNKATAVSKVTLSVPLDKILHFNSCKSDYSKALTVHIQSNKLIQIGIKYLCFFPRKVSKTEKKACELLENLVSLLFLEPFV